MDDVQADLRLYDSLGYSRKDSIFRYAEWSRVVAELIDVDSADYQWTADDTGQRDLTRRILDEVELLEKSPITLDVTVRMKSGKVIKISTIDAITSGRRMTHLLDFIEREYPSK